MIEFKTQVELNIANICKYDMGFYKCISLSVGRILAHLLRMISGNQIYHVFVIGHPNHQLRIPTLDLLLVNFELISLQIQGKIAHIPGTLKGPFGSFFGLDSLRQLLCPRPLPCGVGPIQTSCNFGTFARLQVLFWDSNPLALSEFVQSVLPYLTLA